MIWQMIEDWFRGILTDGILSNLSGLFDSVNTEVGNIATEVGTTPAGWNAGIFNMIRSLSENVIVPIAGVIITFVMCYELIQLVIEKTICTILTLGFSSSGFSRPLLRCCW